MEYFHQRKLNNWLKMLIFVIGDLLSGKRKIVRLGNISSESEL